MCTHTATGEDPGEWVSGWLSESGGEDESEYGSEDEGEFLCLLGDILSLFEGKEGRISPIPLLPGTTRECDHISTLKECITGFRWNQKEKRNNFSYPCFVEKQYLQFFLLQALAKG